VCSGVSSAGRQAPCDVKPPVLVLLLLALAARGSPAQQMEPRTYSNVPVGMNFLIAGVAHTEGSVAVDPSLPLTNAKIASDVAFIAYARVFDLWGRSAKFDASLPYGRTSGSAEFAGQPVSRDIAGPGDARLRISTTFVGAPALPLEAFARYRQNTIMGASVELVVPTGQYDESKLVNIGANRWSIRPEFGISQAWGPLTAELSAGVTFFSDNEEFLGVSTREQAPIRSLQGHLIYTRPSGLWFAVTGTWYGGGRTSIDGVDKDDRQENVRVGVTAAVPVTRHSSIKVFASTGAYSRTNSDFDLLGVAYQYRWGAGF
jgi:hypothetical protein